MKVVLDTNVLLAAIAKKNRWRPIYDAFISEKYTLLLTIDIFFEYLEKLQEKTSISVAYNVGEILETKSNVSLITINFKWNLIVGDEEDNKFADCALAANADYLVTNDAHFNVLKNKEFPPIKVISAEDFLQLLLHE